MSPGPVRVLLTAAAVSAALATVVFANLGMPLGAAVAAAFAIGFVAAGWRRND
jgi:hypothetical protein